MIKAELEKEAEEYARDTYEMCSYQGLPYASDRRAREQAYIAAEPREKRIAELEAQIEKMKCCGNCKYRELIREYGQWKERFNCKGNGCVCHSKWEIR